MDQRPADGLVLLDERVYGVRYANEYDGGAYVVIGERLDEVGEHRPCLGAMEPVKLIDDRQHDVAAVRKVRELASNVLRGYLLCKSLVHSLPRFN